ncbi:unnamed protein product [Cutaneotrichosporon oleaginosum]
MPPTSFASTAAVFHATHASSNVSSFIHVFRIMTTSQMPSPYTTRQLHGQGEAQSKQWSADSSNLKVSPLTGAGGIGEPPSQSSLGYKTSYKE